jgi:hypothetical protein
VPDVLGAEWREIQAAAQVDVEVRGFVCESRGFVRRHARDL